MTPPDQRIADGSSRAGVLTVLRERKILLRVEDLAEAVNLSLSAVRFHLDRLIADGLVRTAKEPRQTPGRPRVMYQAVPEEAVDDGAAYRRLAAMLATELATRGGASAAECAGRAWAADVVAARASQPPAAASSAASSARSAAKPPVPASRRPRAAASPTAEVAAPPDCLADLLCVLEDGGFAPQVVDEGWAVELHRCPYADLMPGQAEVVCAVHRGLLQALPELGGAHDQLWLEPVPEGGSPCVVHFVR